MTGQTDEIRPDGGAPEGHLADGQSRPEKGQDQSISAGSDGDLQIIRDDTTGGVEADAKGDAYEWGSRQEGGWEYRMRRGIEKLSRGNRGNRIAEYKEGNEVIRTRADSIGRKGIDRYRTGGNIEYIKKDWICVCKARNFERNRECRGCGRGKREGLVSTVEINLDRKKENNREEVNRGKEASLGETNSTLEKGVENRGEVENTQAGNVRNKQEGRKIRNGGKIMGIQTRRFKDETSMIDTGRRVELKFIKSDGKQVTMEELDEALSCEKKGMEEIEGISRGYTGVLVHLKEGKENEKWRDLTDNPIKVSSTALYLGKIVRKSSDVTRIKITGAPPWIEEEEILEWLAWYGTVQSSLRVRRAVRTTSMTNIGGLIDKTSIEVDCKLVRHLRDKEYLNGHCLRIWYENMPGTCFSCKQPGSECQTGGRAGYACKIRTPEISLEEMYSNLEKERESEADEYGKRQQDSNKFRFEEVDTGLGDTLLTRKENDQKMEDDYEVAGIRYRGREDINKETCKAVVGGLLEDLEREGTDQEKIALNTAEIMEEEIKGKLKAFSILMDPLVSEKIWKKLRHLETVTPIIMSKRRWKEEKAVRDKLEKEREEEKKITEERRRKRETSEEEESKKRNEKIRRKNMVDKIRKKVDSITKEHNKIMQSATVTVTDLEAKKMIINEIKKEITEVSENISKAEESEDEIASLTKLLDKVCKLEEEMKRRTVMLMEGEEVDRSALISDDIYNETKGEKDKKNTKEKDQKTPTVIMKERRKKLAMEKLNNNCPEPCNDRSCLLRKNKVGGKGCQCSTATEHCYHCFKHVCGICEESEIVEDGIRKCKEGECTPEETKPTQEQEQMVKTKEKSRIKTRCWSCKICRETCESAGRKKENWCVACIRKITEGKKCKLGCSKRELCPKYLEAGREHDGKVENDESDAGKKVDSEKLGEKKQKSEESPANKPNKQKERLESEDIDGTTHQQIQN